MHFVSPAAFLGAHRPARTAANDYRAATPAIILITSLLDDCQPRQYWPLAISHFGHPSCWRFTRACISPSSAYRESRDASMRSSHFVLYQHIYMRRSLACAAAFDAFSRARPPPIAAALRRLFQMRATANIVQAAMYFPCFSRVE